MQLKNGKIALQKYTKQMGKLCDTMYSIKLNEKLKNADTNEKKMKWNYRFSRIWFRIAVQ